jgi:hypothetical protein
MLSLPAWLLPLFLFCVWFLGAFAAIWEKCAQEVRAGTPPEQRGGVSVLPVIPLFPLFFWGISWLVDRFFRPWGCVGVGALHVILALLMLGTLLRDVRFCRLSNRRACPESQGRSGDLAP